jgi:hypothetical protein
MVNTFMPNDYMPFRAVMLLLLGMYRTKDGAIVNRLEAVKQIMTEANCTLAPAYDYVMRWINANM